MPLLTGSRVDMCALDASNSTIEESGALNGQTHTRLQANDTDAQNAPSAFPSSLSDGNRWPRKHVGAVKMQVACPKIERTPRWCGGTTHKNIHQDNVCFYLVCDLSN